MIMLLSLRYKVFLYELRYLNRQLKQFSLLLFLLLWTSIPAIAFSLLLGIGIVLQNEAPQHHIVLLVWSFNLISMLLVAMLSNAIKGASYELYLNSLNQSNSKKHAITALLSLSCQPILLLTLIVIFAIPISRWSEVMHGWGFVALLIMAAFLALFHLRQGIMWISLCLIWLGLMAVLPDVQTIPLVIHMLVLLSLGVFTYFIPSRPKCSENFRGFKLGVILSFWLRLYRSHASTLLLHIALTAVTISLATFSMVRGEHISQYVFFVATQLLIINGSMIQQMANKTIDGHKLYFSLVMQSRALKAAQFTLPLALGSVSIVIFSIIYGDLVYVLADFVNLILCLAVMKNIPRAFVPCWFGLFLLAVFFRFAF